jgi:hypothetical protein
MRFMACTLFVNHASGFLCILNQVSLKAGKTVVSKKAFELLASTFCVGYLADNVTFNSAEFCANLTSNRFNGVVAHHQSGVAKRSIKTITLLAWAMILHMTFHCPVQADLQLWPFGVQHVAYIWNHLPNKISRVSPSLVMSNVCPGSRVTGWQEDPEMASTFASWNVSTF